MLDEMICTLCGDILVPRPRKLRIRVTGIDDEVTEELWEVWRCPTCGFIGLFLEPPRWRGGLLLN
jgi:RNase P subunit RPR2